MFSYLSGTLTPSGTVSVDCDSSKTFTCNVTGIGTNPIAGWKIMNLVNIVAPGTNGFATATNNGRITTTAMDGNTPTSTITIHDFTMNDNNGTIQCINTGDGSDQGMATVSVGEATCRNCLLNVISDHLLSAEPVHEIVVHEWFCMQIHLLIGSQ